MRAYNDLGVELMISGGDGPASRPKTFDEFWTAMWGWQVLHCDGVESNEEYEAIRAGAQEYWNSRGGKLGMENFDNLDDAISAILNDLRPADPVQAAAVVKRAWEGYERTGGIQ